MSGQTVAIVQARMGSVRLPEKVLKDIAGLPMLQHVIERTRVASTIDDVIIATSELEQDDPIVDFCRRFGTPWFRGSERDVLDRYFQAATEFDVDTVVRVTGDCPLISPEVIDRIVRVYFERDGDYVTNTLHYTYPDGLDVEALSYDALRDAWENSTDASDREHVTKYVREHDAFARVNVENPVDIYDYSFVEEGEVLRWTVDYPEDLEFIRAVHDQLWANGPWHLNQVAVLELLEREPEILEGYGRAKRPQE